MRTVSGLVPIAADARTRHGLYGRRRDRVGDGGRGGGRTRAAADLIGAGDVLVSTAGPFMKVGRPVLAAAVNAGAVYLDPTGGPPFIRQVFEKFGPRAERTGAVLLTAFGYDYVPGNLAGALALQAAGPAVARVQVGYFVRGDIWRGTSAGTRASVTGVLLEPGYAFRGGRMVRDRTAADVTSFTIDGKKGRPCPSAHRSISRCPGSGGQTVSPRRRRSPTWASTSDGSAAPPGSSTTAPHSPRR